MWSTLICLESRHLVTLPTTQTGDPMNATGTSVGASSEETFGFFGEAGNVEQRWKQSITDVPSSTSRDVISMNNGSNEEGECNLCIRSASRRLVFQRPTPQYGRSCRVFDLTRESRHLWDGEDRQLCGLVTGDRIHTLHVITFHS